MNPGNIIFYKLCKVLTYLTGYQDDPRIFKNLLKFKPYSKTALREHIILADFSDIRFGLADRLIGILSLLMLAKETGRTLKIHHTCDFLLQEYLQPNTINWLIAPSEIAYGLNESRPLILELERKRLTKKGLPELSHSILQYHTYTNIDLREFITTGILDKYDRHELFHELFRPSPHLEKLLQQAASELDGKPYIAVHFRFMNYLEQVERDSESTTTETEKQHMIEKCRQHLQAIHRDFPDFPILLFTDSQRFSQESHPNFVKILPGEIGHISKQSANQKAVVDKAFTDLFLLSRATQIINVVGPNLRRSGFSKLAAEFGGISYTTRAE